MRKTIYVCDTCDIQVDRKDAPRTHISLFIGGNSGIAVRDDEGHWSIPSPVNPTGIHHFCSAKHLADFLWLLGMGEPT